MGTIVWWNAGREIETKKENGDHCMWNAGGVESSNKGVKWRPLFGGTQEGGSLNQEVEWRPVFG